MTNNPSSMFGDLEDKEFWTSKVDAAATVDDCTDVVIFEEACPKCAGTGNWRPGYSCFKCKGTGKLVFKTSAKARVSGRKSAAKSAVKKADDMATKWTAWCGDHKAVGEWLTAGVLNNNSFAMSLAQGGFKYGHLTSGQEAAVYKAIARDEDGAAGFEKWCESQDGVLEWLQSNAKAGNEFAASLLSAGIRYGSLTTGQLDAVLNNIAKDIDGANDESDLDISGLKGYFAVPDGDTRLKLCIRHKGKQSYLHGWIFVDDGAAYGSRQTYGKQAPEAGSTYTGKVQDALREIMKDPLAAQVAYGKLTGSCGHCGKILEDPKSIAAGIGPVCAAKYG